MKLVYCDCGKRPNITTVIKIGAPSGDSGYETTVECRSCGSKLIRWALRKSWSINSAKEDWNKMFKDD